MSRVPKLPPARLRRLRDLAQMKADAELARLAVTAQSRARLRAALDALGAAEPPLSPAPEAPGADGQGTGGPGDDTTATMPAPVPVDPLLVRARLAHAAWIEGRRRELNARLAMVQADWLRLQPAAARAHGRAQVLNRLTEDAEHARRDRATRGPQGG